MKKIGLGILFFGLIGCATNKHASMRGTVALKAGNSKAFICLGEDSVKVGDEIIFYENKCTNYGAGEYNDVRCSMKKLGEGNVSKLLNNHYSEVTTEGDFEFKEGTLVESADKL